MKIVGVMTGNSLDAVDVVLTAFEQTKMKDIACLSKPYPVSLRQDFLSLRKKIKAEGISKVCATVEFESIVEEYTRLVAQTVNELLENFDKQEITAIGFHGQTLDHFPPSIAGDKKAYTLQVGDALLLANLTQLPVVYDFRSDDMLNGGEGAPLAPMHNLHLAQDLKTKGVFPVAFCNAGNTGNIALISENEAKKESVLGWDIGPFNHFADHLVRTFKGEACDFDGKYGKQGEIKSPLLQELFHHVATNEKGGNYYLQTPPKSSDPSWYKFLEVLNCEQYGFADTLRTVEYLSTYSFVYNLKYIPDNLLFPKHFLLFGGGWKNPLCFADFQALLENERPILQEHKQIFKDIFAGFSETPKVCWSNQYGYSGEFMEARIFADLAYCKIKNMPFTTPEITNCKSPTVCGIWAHPNDEREKHALISRIAKD
ncbi:MAG: anhydro-N-acetylmuramic acid kinase [Alphaproteobacteria bacterium]|nr:anhydro-N-acetylmuramic acid kinase [Alphaproteobacteria bacterium]